MVILKMSIVGVILLSVSSVQNEEQDSLSDLSGVALLSEVSKWDSSVVSWYSMRSVLKAGDCGITASGEKFNEKELTFACWHLDFGTEVEFRNPRTGKTVVARCNDRGPAKRLVRKGRLFDLSKEGFSRIADLKIGVVKIEWRVLNQENGG
jgi:rare lipoprotein A